MKYILSIIIPIYKVERYIRTCLESILTQIDNQQNIELILINDGTPDRSAEIAESIIKDFKFAKINAQSNQGLSVARNNGLKCASGEYVWFIDSDDSICPESIKGIIDSLKRKPDLLQLNYQYTYEDGRVPVSVIPDIDYDIIKSGKDVIAKKCLPVPAQFTIYRRQFLIENELLFMPGILHEDSEFKPRATYLAKKIMWHKPIVYNYLQRQSGSITSQYKLKNGLDSLKGNDSLHSFYKSRVAEKDCVEGIRRCISTNINSMLMGLRSLKDTERKILIAEMHKKKYLFKDMIFSKNFKYSIEGILLMLNVHVAMRMHSVLR